MAILQRCRVSIVSITIIVIGVPLALLSLLVVVLVIHLIAVDLLDGACGMGSVLLESSAVVRGAVVGATCCILLCRVQRLLCSLISIAL